jgi:hypothetical protein
MSGQKPIEHRSKSVPVRRIIGEASNLEHAALLFGFPVQTFPGSAESPPQDQMAPAETFGTDHIEEIDSSVSIVLDRLVTALSSVSAVIAIIADPIEDHKAIHITVFADKLTDDVRDTIYSAELAIIDEHKDMVFDFHVREAECVDERPLIPPAPYALVLWHRTGANAQHR